MVDSSTEIVNKKEALLVKLLEKIKEYLISTQKVNSSKEAENAIDKVINEYGKVKVLLEMTSLFEILNHDNNFNLFVEIITLFPENISTMNDAHLCFKKLFSIEYLNIENNKNTIEDVLNSLESKTLGDIFTVYPELLMKCIDGIFDIKEVSDKYLINKINRKFEKGYGYSFDELLKISNYIELNCSDMIEKCRERFSSAVVNGLLKSQDLGGFINLLFNSRFVSYDQIYKEIFNSIVSCYDGFFRLINETLIGVLKKTLGMIEPLCSDVVIEQCFSELDSEQIYNIDRLGVTKNNISQEIKLSRLNVASKVKCYVQNERMLFRDINNYNYLFIDVLCEENTDKIKPLLNEAKQACEHDCYNNIIARQKITSKYLEVRRVIAEKSDTDLIGFIIDIKNKINAHVLISDVCFDFPASDSLDSKNRAMVALMSAVELIGRKSYQDTEVLESIEYVLAIPQVNSLLNSLFEKNSLKKWPAQANDDVMVIKRHILNQPDNRLSQVLLNERNVFFKMEVDHGDNVARKVLDNEVDFYMDNLSTSMISPDAGSGQYFFSNDQAETDWNKAAKALHMLRAVIRINTSAEDDSPMAESTSGYINTLISISSVRQLIIEISQRGVNVASYPQEIADLILSSDLIGYVMGIDNQYALGKITTIPQVYSHLESHYQEASNRELVKLITKNYIEKLNLQIEHVDEDDSETIFDFNDETGEIDIEQSLTAYYVLRHLIRISQDDDIDDEARQNIYQSIDTMLNIPSVSTLVVTNASSTELPSYHSPHYSHETNELLRLAMSVEDQHIRQRLLEISEVQIAAEANNFYGAQSETNLQEIANDTESSMKALTPEEKNKLLPIEKEYSGSISHFGGVDFVIEHLKSDLARRYNAETSKRCVTIEAKEYELPLSWDELQNFLLEHKVSPSDREAVMQVYYENEYHSAYRYLSDPNHWMDDTASYVYIDTDTGLRSSTFGDYKKLIVQLYLAAIDTHHPPLDSSISVEHRFNLFITQLHMINRAHNWDDTRPVLNENNQQVYDSNGDPLRAQYHNTKQGDKPSCYSGVKKRLCRSLMYHPLSQDLDASIVRLFIKQQLRDHYHDFFLKASLASLEFWKQSSYDYLVSDEIDKLFALKPLEIDKSFTQLCQKNLLQTFGNRAESFVHLIGKTLHPMNKKNAFLNHYKNASLETMLDSYCLFKKTVVQHIDDIVIKHLKLLKKESNSFSQYKSFKTRTAQIQKDGLTVIWDDIEEELLEKVKMTANEFNIELEGSARNLYIGSLKEIRPSKKLLTSIINSPPSIVVLAFHRSQINSNNPTLNTSDEDLKSSSTNSSEVYSIRQ